jgi:hypothetical protein
MLIAKCHALALHMKDGGTVRPRGVLLHDPSGRYWPKNSCLITTFRKSGRPLENPTDEEVAWASNPKSVRAGSAFVPGARSMSSWSRVGEVVAIDYRRVGEYADEYNHECKRPVPLYRKGRVYRLELGKGATFNWRGFVSP